jgi:hypothetical protein
VLVGLESCVLALFILAEVRLLGERAGFLELLRELGGVK